MKQGLKCQRILILFLLSISVLAPIFFFSKKLSDITISFGHKEFVEDLSSVKYRTDTLKLNAIQQDTGEGLKGPTHVVYKDENINSVVSDDAKVDSGVSLLDRNGTNQDSRSHSFEEKGKVTETVIAKSNGRSQPRRVTDEKVREMKDQVIRAKAYLNFAPASSNSHLVKELRLRIKEIERAVGEATKDSDLSRSALQKMISMESVLAKAGRIYPDCCSMAIKLRAMTYNAEEQVRTQKNQASYLVQLAARTTSKGLHCLSMRLTADYFALQPEKRVLPNQQRIHDTKLYHFAVFSDNVLACSAVANSTISASLDPEKVVIHVVTDALNLPAITMWFLLNPPMQSTIEVKSIDDFEWLSSKYGSALRSQNSQDPRYTSQLNYLRFYLPEVFPALDKIVLLDHDVVVQRDLKALWSVGMKGKVIGVVQTCRESEPSFHRMDMLLNFSDPFITKRFSIKACTWAFGMNVFDLREWRLQNLTALYHQYLEADKKKPLFTGGSLPLGLATFYNRMVVLDRRWHVLGLGYESGVGRGEIERAAVIHYDGTMKPWLEIGIVKYKSYWNKHVKYDHPYLQQCNIHQ
ncbi:hypothetical protein AQUCO_01700613v1 [Aquilegia coerulea]|uniref:Hexosyltransferase n=1 Tax=Aquilegia coerulea TaxID=218851 RepID=A0A2G5DNU0_AQUCA|nr:hypothetical protein AQUCO_01700613v1 [Aquilegia coerulea]